MNLLKLGLRALVTVGSIFSFMVGWVLLGHSPKPTQPSTTSRTTNYTSSIFNTVPTLVPLPPMGQDGGNNNSGFQQNPPLVVQQQPVFQQPAFPQFGTQFTTAGS